MTNNKQQSTYWVIENMEVSTKETIKEQAEKMKMKIADYLALLIQKAPEVIKAQPKTKAKSRRRKSS